MTASPTTPVPTTAAIALGDDALVLSHRLGEWAGHAPVLEEEVALANIALDLLGQARVLLSMVGDEDELAYLREERSFRNLQLVEQPNGDFAVTIARLLVFSTWRLALFGRLTASADPVLAAIAEKGVKELAYHRDHAAQWTLRLAGGTEFSRERMVAGLARIWPLVDELFTTHAVEAALPGVAVPSADVRAEVDEILDQVFTAATLDRPVESPMSSVAGKTGRDGVHTEAMGYLLAEMQHLARSLPGARW